MPLSKRLRSSQSARTRPHTLAALNGAGLVNLSDMQAVLDAFEPKLEELAFVRPEVLAFAKLMEHALRRKDSQYGGNSWQRFTLPEEIAPHAQDRIERVWHLVKQARRERQMGNEIAEQLHVDNAASEAVHAANYAMMIVDIAGGLRPHQKGAVG